MNSTNLGIEIRRRRLGLRYSRAKMAKKVDISSQLIYYMEKGERSISDSYLKKLDRLERESQIGERISLEEPCPPVVKSMYQHLLNHEDSMAQQLGEYVLKHMDEKDPDWVRITHFTTIAYSLELKDTRSSKGRELASRCHELASKGRELTLSAFKALKDSKQDTWLRHAIINEMLGYRFRELDSSNFIECEDVFNQVRQLFNEDPKEAYLWNALEVLCRCERLYEKIPELLECLYKVASRSSVNKRIQSDRKFLPSRPYIW